MTIFAAVTTLVFTTVSICSADNDYAAYDDYSEELVDYVANDTLDKPPIFYTEENNDLDDMTIARKKPGLPNGIPKWARGYTLSKRGCPCWWDLTLGNKCACCKNKGQSIGSPCGYPLHNFCQDNALSKNRGCPGANIINKIDIW